jgi:5-methyltetrahydropteroyltriglutamate--homocysteine methyltransferase
VTAAKSLPFRAEHVGSLLRPAELKQAFQAFKAGKMDAAAYDVALERAIRGAVRIQEDAGLESITDGEFGRGSWFGFFFERMDGFRLEPSAFRFKDESGGSFEWPTCVACGRIHRKRGITTDEFTRLRGHTSRTPKMTMPSPSAFHFFRLNAPVDPKVYPDLEEYWDDLIGVFKAEIADLAKIGCRYIQIDEVPLAMLCDPSVREQVQALGGDPAALIDRYVKAIARIVDGAPDFITFGLHLCRGNFRNRWMASGGYEPVAEKLFATPIDAFFLEYDSPRAGDFSPLRYVAGKKHVVLGLISSKSAALESQDDLRRRIDDAARFVPLERLALSPQCGFASVAGGNMLSEDEEKAKLALVVETARKVWDV